MSPFWEHKKVKKEEEEKKKRKERMMVLHMGGSCEGVYSDGKGNIRNDLVNEILKDRDRLVQDRRFDGHARRQK